MPRCRKPRQCLPYAAPSIFRSAKGGKSASESIPFACQKDTYRNVKGMLLQRHSNIAPIWQSNRMRLYSARTQMLSTGNRQQQWWKILITILDKKISQQSHHSSHRHIKHCMSTSYDVMSCIFNSSQPPITGWFWRKLYLNYMKNRPKNMLHDEPWWVENATHHTIKSWQSGY